MHTRVVILAACKGMQHRDRPGRLLQLLVVLCEALDRLPGALDHQRIQGVYLVGSQASILHCGISVRHWVLVGPMIKAAAAEQRAR